jgi:hypothetical protein
MKTNIMSYVFIHNTQQKHYYTSTYKRTILLHYRLCNVSQIITTYPVKSNRLIKALDQTIRNSEGPVS